MRFNVYAVSICSRPSRDGSAMMTTSNAGRGRSGASRAVNPARRSNSAPETRSSMYTWAGLTVQPFVAA
jgi:hypothetical protein